MLKAASVKGFRGTSQSSLVTSAGNHDKQQRNAGRYLGGSSFTSECRTTLVNMTSMANNKSNYRANDHFGSRDCIRGGNLDCGVADGAASTCGPTTGLKVP